MSTKVASDTFKAPTSQGAVNSPWTNVDDDDEGMMDEIPLTPGSGLQKTTTDAAAASLAHVGQTEQAAAVLSASGSTSAPHSAIGMPPAPFPQK
jgi:hypothetical protein